MKIFIGGCARSGTTLIARLMRNFEATFAAEKEAPVTAFEEFAGRAENLIVKRMSGCHKTLPDLPEDVRLLYCVRHPFDVLTSSHPDTVHKRRFHVTPKRWGNEYRALGGLRLRQPDRRIFLLRYEDLVASPDEIQRAIGAHFGLLPSNAFSNDPDERIYRHSVRKWETRADYREYLLTLGPWLLKAIESFCLEFGYSLPEGFSSTRDARSGALSVRRLIDEPIIRPDMLPGGLGGNINGPSLIRAPAWLPRPLGRYYLYFAHHQGDHIRLAYADRLEGPWRIHPGGTLKLSDAPMCHGHIASPDVHVDDGAREICMIFHGPAKGGSKQKSFLALSRDGVTFTASPDGLAPAYLRVVPFKRRWLGMTRGGTMRYSESIATAFRPIRGNVFDSDSGNVFGATVRHVALRLAGPVLDVFYTWIGDAPERIWRCRIDLVGASSEWRARDHQPVLAPERSWEGALLPVQPSRLGIAPKPENALRDPAIFMENNQTYLLYSVAGEQGIAIARLEERQEGPV